MAAGFKQATVNASDVPASQSNYPAYVDLSRVGITTLAEAQSVRCYSDSGKTTELAREIVSVTEMHVKIPSLTSTFVLYIDYDGVSADYAVTDTYGRNAVWSDYEYVTHMEGNANNSTGGTNPSATTNITFSTGNGKIGQGAGFNGSSSLINISLAIPTSYTIQYWGRARTSTTRRFISKDTGSGTGRALAHEWYTSPNLDLVAWNSGNTIKGGALGTFTANTWYLVHASWDSSGNYVTYKDGTAITTAATGGNAKDTAAALNIGNGGSLSRFLNGEMDELRVSDIPRSANWITTENNNQSDEAGFWGTWTDVSGGATRRVFVIS